MSSNAHKYSTGNEDGFLKKRKGMAKGRQRIKWHPKNDRHLLLFGLGKEIIPSEYAAIAETFKEKPTPKAIQERLTKLRKRQLELIAKLKNVGSPKTTIHVIEGEAGEDEDWEDDDDDDLASPTPSGAISAAKTEEEEAAEILLAISRGERVGNGEPQRKKKKATGVPGRIGASAANVSSYQTMTGFAAPEEVVPANFPKGAGEMHDLAVLKAAGDRITAAREEKKRREAEDAEEEGEE